MSYVSRQGIRQEADQDDSLPKEVWDEAVQVG
jgi:hypothetical protein